MLDLLEKGGVAVHERNGKRYVDGGRELTRSVAGHLCSEIVARWKVGKCSIRQAAVLKKHGYSTDMSFEDARRTLDRLKANGWKRPADEPVEVMA